MKKHRVQKKFLAELKRIPIVQVACERCGLSRQSVYRWRHEDPDFENAMDIALDEGESLVNDMCESQLLSLIKNKQFSAVRFWLIHRHPKYKPPIKEKVEVDQFDPDRVIKEMGLTDDDFSDANLEDTTQRILKYVLSK